MTAAAFDYERYVWSYDFVEDHLRNGKKLRFLNIINEYTQHPPQKLEHQLM